MKNVLKTLRKNRNVTQQEVAEAINVDRVSYTRYENGTRTPTSEVLVALAKFYNCTTDYLLGLTSEPNLVNMTNLPKELTAEGIEALEITQEAMAEGLSAQDIKDIIEMALKLRKKD